MFELTESQKKAKQQFINWQLEYESIEMHAAKGEDLPEHQTRLDELEILLNASIFSIDQDYEGVRNSWEDLVVITPPQDTVLSDSTILAVGSQYFKDDYKSEENKETVQAFINTVKHCLNITKYHLTLGKPEQYQWRLNSPDITPIPWFNTDEKGAVAFNTDELKAQGYEVRKLIVQP